MGHWTIPYPLFAARGPAPHVRQHMPIVVFGRSDEKESPPAFMKSPHFVQDDDMNISSHPIVRFPFFARYSTKWRVSQG